MPTPDSRSKPGDARVAPGSQPLRGAGRPPAPPQSDGTAAAAPQSQRNNLVLPRSPLIGREHEAAAVQTLLLQEAVALLTLTGPGGIGKTHLALQVAANLVDHFMDGVYFVSLAPIRDPQQVCAAIAQALAVQETAGRPLVDSLLAFLGNTALSWLAHGEQDYTRALAHLHEALAIHRAAGSKIDIASTLVFIANVRRAERAYAGAQSLLEEALALFEEEGAAWEVADVLHYMGQGAQLQGEYGRAWALFQESLARWQAIGTLLWKGIPECLEGLAEICIYQWQFVPAAHLFGAAEALYGKLGAATQPFLPSTAKAKFATLKVDLGEAAFVAAWSAGHDFTPEQAVEYALALPDLSAAAPAFVLPRPPANPERLTAREVEVLRLFVSGMTYAEIGRQLFVSRRTVNAHVTSIYAKLGVNNRTAAARYAAEHKLI